MDRDLAISALTKLLKDEIMNQEELDCLKDFLLCGAFLSDMDDIAKEMIMTATLETINQVFKDVTIKTAKRTLKMRYGL